MVLGALFTYGLVIIFMNVNNMSRITNIILNYNLSPVGCLKVLSQALYSFLFILMIGLSALLCLYLFYLPMILTFYSGKKSSYCFDTLNIKWAKLSTWFKVNKLSVNVKKTNYIIFNSRHGEFGSLPNCTSNLFIELNLVNS